MKKRYTLAVLTYVRYLVTKLILDWNYLPLRGDNSFRFLDLLIRSSSSALPQSQKSRPSMANIYSQKKLSQKTLNHNYFSVF